MASLQKYIDGGADIAGSAVPALLESFLVGPVAAGALSELAVICVKGLNDWVHRQQSQREATRSAAALIYTFKEIEMRLNAGQQIRNDDFFRLRTGCSVDAQTVLEGVLVKSKLQYEERKIQLIGNLLAAISFDETISADDACWYLNLIDSLNYQSLLIVAALSENQHNTQNDVSMETIYKRDNVVLLQISHLRNIGLIEQESGFVRDISLSKVGEILVSSMKLVDELNLEGDKIRRILF